MANLTENAKVNVVQEYVKCNIEKKFLLLNTLLKKNVDKKVLVLCSSASILNFLSELLQCFKISVVTMHENMPQAEQNETCKAFSDAKESIMICTDKCTVPFGSLSLDWLVQYDPPSSFTEYVKMLKSLNKSTRALLFLQPDEISFLSHLKKKNVSSNEFEVKWSKVSNVQAEVHKLASKVYAIHMCATDAYKTFVKFYAGHSMSKVFDVKSLDLSLTAKGFGLNVAPFVDIDAVKRSKKRPVEIVSEEVAPSKKPKLTTVKVIQAVKAKKSRKIKNKKLK